MWCPPSATHIHTRVPYALIFRYISNAIVRRISSGPCEMIWEVPAGRIYLEGDVLTAAEEGAGQERRKLAFAGSVFVSLVLDGQGQVRGEPQVRLHGLPEEDSKGLSFEERALDAVAEALNRLDRKSTRLNSSH